MQNAGWSAPPVSEARTNTAQQHSAQSGTTKAATIYAHYAAWVAIALIVVHQSLVAASTIFLTKVIERFQAGGDYHLFLYLYLLAMALPYIPGCGSLVLLQQWINGAHGKFIELLSEKIKGKVSEYRDAALRDRITATLARNSLPVLREYITFMHDLVSFTLNSSLSMVVIVLLLPSNLALGYVVSFALCSGIIFGFRKVIAASSSDCEFRYLAYTDALNKAWDNVALGNTYNEAIWRRRKEEAGHAFYKAATTLQLRKQLGNVLLAGASLLPTIFLIVALFQGEKTSLNRPGI